MESHFAALRIPEGPEKSLTRAISFSELPTSRRIVFQQAETSGQLIRQYSCEHIYDKLSNTRRFNVLTSVTSKLEPSGLGFPKLPIFQKSQDTGWHTRLSSFPRSPQISENLPTIELNGLKLFDSPPMPQKSPKKFPSNSHQLHPTMVPPNPPTQPSEKPLPPKKFQKPPKSQVEISEMKKKLRPLVPAEFSRCPNRSTSLHKLAFLTLVSIAVGVISVIVFEANQKPLDLTNTTIALRRNVLWQDEAVEQLVRHFQADFDNFTAVVLVGGTGVGKTFTANIMKKHFPYKYNVFEYSPPIMEHAGYDSLSQLHCNLVVLENLRTEDVGDFFAFAKRLRGQKKCAIVLGVLNPQVVDENLVRTMDLDKSVGEIRRLLGDEGIKGEVVRFQQLGPEAIRDCIMREVEDSEVVLSDRDYQRIKEQLVTMNSGCKGALAKVNLLGRRQGL